jgi:hypothetical protein
MKVYNYSEARQNFSTVLNTALKLETIKGIKPSAKDLTMGDILDAIREDRERYR